MKRILGFLGAIPLVLLFLSSPCGADKDTLVVGEKVGFESLCQTLSSSRQTLILCHNWADTLVYRDPYSGEILPCLAESYRVLDGDTLEFILRPGVRFHNGEPLSAEAVAYSMEVFSDEEALSRPLFRAFKDVLVVDDRTVRIPVTIHPRAALEVLANVFFILPPEYHRKSGNSAFGRRPVGTGPYRFVSWDDSQRIVFTENPDYFGLPKGRPRIPNLEFHVVPEEMIRIEMLMNGRLDLIRSGSITPEQILFLETHPEIRVRRVDIIRNFFIVMDARGRSGVEHFKDRLVRRAVNHAIDRKAIVEHILRGLAVVNHGQLTPLHFGYEPDTRTYAHDPDRARRLLAAAGRQDGFTVDFYAYRDESVAEAVARDLRAVGIRTNFKWMDGRWDRLFEKIRNGRVPLAFITWGSFSIFDAAAVLDHFFLEDASLCQGTTPEIDRTLREADLTRSEAQRKDLLSRAQKLIGAEAFWAPLYYGNSVAAMRKGLDFFPCHDEIDRYFLTEWSGAPSD
jgi:peptide/nickel transport system substrate-binding protein